VADESDDSQDDREVLSNLPRTRPARRSTRRAPAAPDVQQPPASTAKPKAAPKPAAAKPKRAPARPAAARRAQPRPPEPALPVVVEHAAPPPPADAEHHRSPMADVAVASIELTGAFFRFGIAITRAMVRATAGRVPRP
jgi:hypothetical protein